MRHRAGKVVVLLVVSLLGFVALVPLQHVASGPGRVNAEVIWPNSGIASDS